MADTGHVASEVTEARLDMIEGALNETLRPGQKPYQKYGRTPRLAMQLMADYQLVPQYHPTHVVIHAPSVGLHVWSAKSFKGEKNRIKALMAAVAECALHIALLREKNHGTGTTNVGV